MILSGLLALVVSTLPITPVPAQGGDVPALVRRVAATIQLATQEYGLGVKDGKVVLPPEVEEARLFLTEAGKTAGRLPGGSHEVVAGIDQLLKLVAATSSPDSVRVRRRAGDRRARFPLSDRARRCARRDAFARARGIGLSAPVRSLSRRARSRRWSRWKGARAASRESRRWRGARRHVAPRFLPSRNGRSRGHRDAFV